MPPAQTVPYHTIHTTIADPTPYGTDYAGKFEVEYEAKKNDGTKPYFLYNFTPYPDTCISNCKIDLTLTVDGETCSILWVAGKDTTSGDGRWSLRDCTVTQVGLNKNRQIKMDNNGKIELQGGAPYSEDTFSYTLLGNVVGYKKLYIEGTFKILCYTKDPFLSIPNTFSTDIISFLKAAPGT